MDEHLFKILVNLHAHFSVQVATLARLLDQQGIVRHQDQVIQQELILHNEAEHFLARAQQILQTREEQFRWEAWHIGDLWRRTDPRGPEDTLQE